MAKELLVYDDSTQKFRKLDKNNYNDDIVCGSVLLKRESINEIKKYLGPNVRIMPIVKSFGYGTHLNNCPEILNQFDYVGVALLDEAIALRQNGYKNNILILYPLTKEEFEIFKDYDFILNGCNIFDLIDEQIKDL